MIAVPYAGNLNCLQTLSLEFSCSFGICFRRVGQKACIEDWLASHGLEDVDWFVDQESGSHTNRPGLKQLKQAIFAGDVDTVVVYKIDGLSRSLSDGIALLCEWLEQGVRLKEGCRS